MDHLLRGMNENAIMYAPRAVNNSLSTKCFMPFLPPYAFCRKRFRVTLRSCHNRRKCIVPFASGTKRLVSRPTIKWPDEKTRKCTTKVFTAKSEIKFLPIEWTTLWMMQLCGDTCPWHFIPKKFETWLCLSLSLAVIHKNVMVSGPSEKIFSPESYKCKELSWTDLSVDSRGNRKGKWSECESLFNRIRSFAEEPSRPAHTLRNAAGERERRRWRWNFSSPCHVSQRGFIWNWNSAELFWGLFFNPGIWGSMTILGPRWRFWRTFLGLKNARDWGSMTFSTSMSIWRSMSFWISMSFLEELDVDFY